MVEHDTGELLQTVVLGTLAGEIVGQDCEVYAYDSVYNRFARLALMATRTGTTEVLDDLSARIFESAAPDQKDEHFRVMDWPLPTRELLKACQAAASAKGKRPCLLMLMPESQKTH